MGQTNATSLKNNEIIEFSKASNFSQKNVQLLYSFYNHFSKLQKDDGVIDYNEFCLLLKSSPGKIIHSLFNIFDTNGDSSINFREFLVGISSILNDHKEKQASLLFNILDEDSTGKINKSLMMSSLLEWTSISSDIQIPTDILQQIVEETYSSVGKDSIERNDFMKLLQSTELLNLRFDEDKANLSMKSLKTPKKKCALCGPVNEN